MDEFPIYQLPQNIVNHYLGEIPQPPKKLFIRGIFPTESHLIFLTVVGARKHSNYGRQACEHLIKGLKGYPVVVVSGLAHGIDAIAHQAALDTGIKTIAFPGSGLDKKVLYPRSHMKIAEDILKSGGCLVSEFEHTQGSTEWTFPQRNRLMAGISRATLIIEATHKSGSRITTKLTTEYNRDVLAVPGEIFNQLAEGPNELIRMGATPITSPQELLEALGFDVTPKPPADLFSQCTDEESEILKLLGSPKLRGDLIRESKLSIHKANILLSQMEIKELIKDVGGEIRRV